jgi:hypothetical protein
MIVGRFTNDFEGFFARYLVLFCNISTSFSRRARRHQHADCKRTDSDKPKTQWRNRGLPR